MPYNHSGEKIAMKDMTDQQNALLNSLAYANLRDGWDSPNKKTGGPRTLYSVVQDVDPKFANKLKEAGLGDLVIKDYVNKNVGGSGFCAIAFEDPYTGETGMSYRGTEGMDDLLHNPKDMADNVLTASIGVSPQSLEAIAFFEKNEEKNGKNYLFGHSKGGELAAEVYVTNYDNVVELHTVNAQPINPNKLSPDQLVALQSKKFDAIVVNGDVVSWLGNVGYPIRYVQNNGSQEGLFGPHAVDSILLDENGMAVIETEPFSGYLAQGLIANGATAILGAVQNGLHLYSFTINISIRTANFLVNDLPEMVQRFVEYSKQAIDRILDFATDVKNALKDFVGKLVSNVTAMFKQTFNPGYRYATAHPYIKLDTYKLRDYAARLRSINKRLDALDRRMDSLYAKSNLLDLLSLIQADLMTGESWSLQNCAAYLEETAESFEAVERTIMGAI